MGNEEILGVEARLKDFISGQLKTIETNIKSFEGKTKSSFAGAGKASEGFGGSVLKMAGAFGIATTATEIAMRAVAKIQTELMDASNAFLENERSVVMLSGAIRAHGQDIKTVLPLMEKYASEIFNTTRFSDEDARAAETLAISYGYQGSMVRDLLKASANLAVKMNTDLPDAAQTLLRVIEGDSNSLRQLGIKFEGAAGSAEKARNAIKAVNDLHGSASQDDMNTYAGRLADVNKRIEENTEQIGKNLTSLRVWWSEMKLAMSDIVTGNLLPGESDLVKLVVQLGDAKKELRGMEEGYDKFAKKSKVNPIFRLLHGDIKEYEAEEAALKTKIQDIQKQIDEIYHPKADAPGDKTNNAVDPAAKKYMDDLRNKSMMLDPGLGSSLLNQSESLQKKDDDDAVKLAMTTEQMKADAVLAIDIELIQRQAELRETAADREWDQLINDKKRYAAYAEEMAGILATSIGHGTEGLKAVGKQSLKIVVDMLEKKALLAAFGAGFDTLLMNPMALIKYAAIVAAFEAAKGGIMAFAGGTPYAPGGRSLVGEHGPEVVDLPPGSRVYTHKESNNIVNNTPSIYVLNIPTTQSVADALQRGVRDKSIDLGRLLAQAGVKI